MTSAQRGKYYFTYTLVDEGEGGVENLDVSKYTMAWGFVHSLDKLLVTVN